MGLLFTFWVWDVSAAFVAVFLVLAWYLNNNFDYWKKKGVPYVKPLPFVGNFKDLFFLRLQVDKFFQDMYSKLDGKPFGGIYQLRRPVFLPKDPELIKNILIRDFDAFHDRGTLVGGQKNVLNQNLFNLEGKRWKWLRNKLSPTFTSGRMKAMYPLMDKCAQNLQTETCRIVDAGHKETEIKELVSRFSTDVIGSCVFGIECNSLADPDSEFRRMCRDAIGGSLSAVLRQFLVFMFPKIANVLNVKELDSRVETFFINMVGDNVQHRMNSNIVRKDFLQLLIDLKNKGKIEDSETKEHSGSIEKEEFDLNDDLLAAQCFVFFFAGFETSSTVISFCLYELALQPELQQTLREEIDQVLDGATRPNYEHLTQMKLLDRCVSETLRKYPPAGILFRETSRPYTIPGTEITLDRGTRLYIPVSSLHWDRKYFPDPEKFDPERFSDEAKSERQSCTYLPFGEGPRFCIGNRFGLQQVKVALTALLSQFEFSVCGRTDVPIKFSALNTILEAKGGIWLTISKRSA